MNGYVEFPGSRLYYEADGVGSALTLIHACVAHLRMWEAQVAAFGDRFRVIRYDLRGFGRSTTEQVPFSSRDDLRRVLDQLGVERTHLVGASCGG
jgi:3-oxoadipate enol-lactonase